jgi:hypothetical protein
MNTDAEDIENNIKQENVATVQELITPKIDKSFLKKAIKEIDSINNDKTKHVFNINKSSKLWWFTLILFIILGMNQVQAFVAYDCSQTEVGKKVFAIRCC